MKKFIKGIIELIILLIIICFASVYFVYNYLYPMQYKDEIIKYSNENNIDPYLTYAIINVESGFNPLAKSNAEAKGLMQIMPITADWAKEHIELNDLSEDDYFEPDTNIKIGTWYLAKLSSMYNGDVSKIAAAYNAGTGNVESWIIDGRDITNGDIPFEETKKYVEKVNSNIDVYKVLYGADYSKEDAIDAVFKIIQVIYEKANNKLSKYIEK